MTEASAGLTQRIDRAIPILVAALATVAVSAWISMRAFLANLPPEDAAFGSDSFALGMVALPLALLAFGVAWPMLHFGLRGTDLRRSLPLCCGAAMVVTPVVASFHPVLAPVAGLLAGGIGVAASRRRFPRGGTP